MQEFKIGDTITVTDKDSWCFGEKGKIIEVRKEIIMCDMPICVTHFNKSAIEICKDVDDIKDDTNVKDNVGIDVDSNDFQGADI